MGVERRRVGGPLPWHLAGSRPSACLRLGRRSLSPFRIVGGSGRRASPGGLAAPSRPNGGRCRSAVRRRSGGSGCGRCAPRRRTGACAGPLPTGDPYRSGARPRSSFSRPRPWSDDSAVAGGLDRLGPGQNIGAGSRAICSEAVVWTNNAKCGRSHSLHRSTDGSGPPTGSSRSCTPTCSCFGSGLPPPEAGTSARIRNGRSAEAWG